MRPLGICAPKGSFVLTVLLQRILRAMGDGPDSAMSMQMIAQLAAVNRPEDRIRQLLLAGYLERAARVDPPEPGAVRGVVRYWYWRAPAGTAILREIGAFSDDQAAVFRPVILEQKPKPQFDDSGYYKPENNSRDAVTFRDTMHQFGLAGIKQYYTMDRRTSRRFHAAWTRAMYAACAADGIVMPESCGAT